jgi:hypothetical protein
VGRGHGGGEGACCEQGQRALYFLRIELIQEATGRITGVVSVRVSWSCGRASMPRAVHAPVEVPSMAVTSKATLQRHRCVR